MDNNFILSAIAILVGVSVFSTGFLSARLHAQRDRALTRAQEIRDLLAKSEGVKSKNFLYWLADEHFHFKKAYEIDPIARFTAYGNLLALLFAVFLTSLIGINQHWQLIWDPRKVAFEFYTLMTVCLVEAGIVILAIRDIDYVRRDVGLRLVTSSYKTFEVSLDWLKSGHYELARHWLDDLVNDEPEWHLSWFLRGSAYYGQPKELKAEGKIDDANGYYNKAIEDFTKALETNPEDKRIYSFRGSAYKELGEIEKAQKDFDIAKSANLSDQR